MNQKRENPPESDIQDRVKRRLEQILLDEGYRPTRTEHDDINFKSEGWGCYYDFDPNDPGFVRLLIPRMHNVLDGEQEMTWEVASDLNRRFKSVKVFVTEDRSDVSITVEFLVESEIGLCTNVVSRQIDIAMVAAGALRGEIRARREAVLDERRNAVAH